MSKKIILLIFSLIFSFLTYSQEEVSDNLIIKASPENGIEAFKLDFARALTIPTEKIIEINQKHLKLIISFKVDENGKISNVKVINDRHNLNSEISKTFELLPNWIPAQENEKNITSYFTLPIILNISLSNNNSNNIRNYYLNKKEVELFYKEFDSHMHYPNYFWDSYYHKKNNYAMGINASVNEYAYEIRFEIDENGNFTNIETIIEETPNLELNKYTIKALKKCKKWPALIVENQKVRSKFSLPISVIIKR